MPSNREKQELARISQLNKDFSAGLRQCRALLNDCNAKLATVSAVRAGVEKSDSRLVPARTLPTRASLPS